MTTNKKNLKYKDEILLDNSVTTTQSLNYVYFSNGHFNLYGLSMKFLEIATPFYIRPNPNHG